MILMVKNKNNGYNIININFIYNLRIIELLFDYIEILI